MQKTGFKSALSMIMLAVLTVFMPFGLQSCSKDDDGGGDTDESSVIGKWTVADPNAAYGSFEFTNDKKYIITQRTTTPPARSAKVRASGTVYIVIIFGDISSLKGSGNEYTLDLKEFGAITIRIDPARGTATVTVNGETYTTTKEEEIEVTDRTELLCHTWNVKYDEDDEDYDEMIEHTVTFSKSGTYLVWMKYYSDLFNGVGDPESIYESAMTGEWHWTDNTQTAITHTETYDDGRVEESVVSIVELSGHYMKFHSIVEFDGEEWEEITELYR
jgi:hypothetical protein